MPNFATGVQGESRARSFQFNIEENTLSTDLGGVIADPRQATNPDMDELTGNLKLTLGSDGQLRATLDGVGTSVEPVYELYWNSTHLYREAYRICEEEDMSLEAAFDKVSELAPPESDQAQRPTYEPPPSQSYEPPPPPAAEPTADPFAGIIISNQRLLLKVALVMLETGNIDEQQVALIKEELETLDGYEVSI